MENKSIEKIEVPEVMSVNKAESPLKQSIKDMFKHLCIQLFLWGFFLYLC